MRCENPMATCEKKAIPQGCGAAGRGAVCCRTTQPRRPCNETTPPGWNPLRGYGRLARMGRAAGGRQDAAGPTARRLDHGLAAPEISPAFAHDRGVLIITADQRDGLDGWWTKTFPVSGGKHYHFSANYQAKNVAVPRRSVIVKINWQDAQGKKVPLDEPVPAGYLKGATPMAETEFPTTREANAAGWTEMSDTYQAPSKASRAMVELHLHWAPECRGALEPGVLRRDRAARAAQGPVGDDPLPAQRRQDTGGQLPAVRAAHRRGREAEGRPGRARRDAHLFRPGQAVPRGGRADPRALDGVFRQAREGTQPLHRRRPGRAGGASHLQRRGADRAGRQDGRQVSQGLPAARRGRRRHLSRP